MNDHLRIHTGSPASTPLDVLQTQIKYPEIDRSRVRALVSIDGVTAAQEHASTYADGLNAGLRARAQTGLTRAEEACATINETIQGYLAQANNRSTIKFRRMTDADPDLRLTRMEKVQNGIYILFSFAALCVAAIVLASLIKESGVSAELAKSFTRSLTYAFPVVIASSGIASLVTLADDDEVTEARTRMILQWGFGLFIAWAFVSAVVFIGQPEGLSGGSGSWIDLDDEPGTGLTGSAADGFYSALGAFFPASVTGTALLFVHVLSDVLLSAGLTSKVMLSGRKTRSLKPFHCPVAVHANEKVDELEETKARYEAEKEQFKGIIGEIDAVKAAHISEVSALAASDLEMLKSRRAEAQARADAAFRNEKD